MILDNSVEGRYIEIDGVDLYFDCKEDYNNFMTIKRIKQIKKRINVNKHNPR